MGAPFVFNVSADVVEMSMARRLLWELGLQARRGFDVDGDDGLAVFAPPAGSLPSSLWISRQRSQSAVELGNLFVDEGTYDRCLGADGSIRPMNAWEECVHAVSLLAIVARHLEPGYPIKPSPYIGSGRTERWMLAQYREALTRGDQNKHPAVVFTE